jgi:hypothetical protein
MKLIEKIFEIKNHESMQYFQKDAKGFKGNYVKGVSILSALNPLMKKHRVMLLPEIIDAEMSGKHVMLKKRLTWFDIDSDETLPVLWVDFGSAEDLSQAEGKALTYNERYYFMKAFQIATDEDDPDKFKEKNKPSVKLATKAKKVKVGESAKRNGWTKEEMDDLISKPPYEMSSGAYLNEDQADTLIQYFKDNPKSQEKPTTAPETTSESGNSSHLTGKYPREGMEEEDREIRASFIKIRTAESMSTFVHNPANKDTIYYMKETYPHTFEDLRNKFFELCKDSGAKFPFDEPSQ